jgi:hypothetical protein
VVACGALANFSNLRLRALAVLIVSAGLDVAGICWMVWG